MMKLDIISDVACPWCYVGKGYLDRALEANPDHPFEIEWHPFQLDPTIPKGGIDRADYLLGKFGTHQRVVEIHKPLLEHAEKAGVTLDLAAMKKAVNTLDAHRLIHWAGLEGRQSAIVSALFRAYWRDGRDIGDADTLADIAGEAGLDRAMIRRLLATDADRDEIRAREAHARERGVNAVPTFIIADRYVVQGAQPVETWGRIIAELSDRLKGGDDV